VNQVNVKTLAANSTVLIQDIHLLSLFRTLTVGSGFTPDLLTTGIDAGALAD